MIPKRLRERLGIRPGQVLEFEAVNGKLVGVMAGTPDPVEQVLGILGRGKSTDEFVERMRDSPER